MAQPFCKKCANYVPTTGRCRQTNTKTSPWNDGCGEYTLRYDPRLENLKKLICTIALLAVISGCATTPSTVSTKVSEIHAKADRLGTISGKIIKRVGPLVTAGVCLASPVYCAPAKAAYKGAVVAINAIEAAKTAEDGLKLAALAEEIQKNMDTINEVLVASGQEKIDLTELQTTVKECQALTTQ